jgi:ubiquinone/menaquinone biosynthesis C-methylase UbiE
VDEEAPRLDTVRDNSRMTTEQRQERLDVANADFWSELCGSHLARAVGVEDASAESLARFDRAYMDLFPYLWRYIPWRSGERLLEIGPGYGTVGQLLAERGVDYHALDISPGPVEMMVHRLEMLGLTEAGSRVKEGSALDIPHPDESFDVVVSIGCLHHTGDLARAVKEVHRVLRTGGQAMVMGYNRHSYRRALVVPVRMVLSGAWRDPVRRAEFVRRTYDADSEGTAAPATEFASAAEIRRIFAGFSEVRVRRENFGDVVLSIGGKHLFIPRTAFLSNVARIAGLDLYVTATR